MKVYFDNAATTPLDKEVFEAMKPYMTEFHGNPSSIHSHGRKVRSAIEKARKKIADFLNTSPSEIFFTSGGTEADNTIIVSTINTYRLTHVISSPIEHHAVLHTLNHLEKEGTIKRSFVNLDEKGNIDYDHLQTLLKNNPRSLVSLMHANNEIGNLNDLDEIGELCEEFDAFFHSDTIQTIGKYQLDLQRLKLHFLTGSAHKFHGPNGIGFMYIKGDVKINPFIIGGAQERNMRGGTENYCGIVGLSKALEIAYRDMDANRLFIQNLKDNMIKSLDQMIEGVVFNGESANSEKSLYTVLNVGFPRSSDNDMLLFNLDINNISVSGGSACSSGSNIGSHVLTALKTDPDQGAVRFSFSKFNTLKEVEYVTEKLASFFKVSA